ELELLFERRALESIECFAHVGRTPPTEGGRQRIEDDPPADRRDRRQPSQDKAVARRGSDRRRKTQLRPRRSPRLDAAAVQDADESPRLRREVMKRQTVAARDGR